MTVIVPRQPPNQPIGLPAPDLTQARPDATPRAVLPRAVVAAAVASLPTLSPVLVPHEPEYCLAAKRKANADADDAPDDQPRPIKRAKSDPEEALFGALATPPQADPPQPSPFDVAIEQAIAAAALYVFPPDAHPQPSPIAVDSPSLVDPLAVHFPSPPLGLSPFGDVLPADNVAVQTWQDAPVPDFFSGDVSPQPIAGPSTTVVPPPVVAVEGIDIIQNQPEPELVAEPEQQACEQAAQSTRRSRNKQDSLWVTACKERMAIVIGLCKTWEALREVLGQPAPKPKKAEEQTQQPQPQTQPQDDSVKNVANSSRSGTTGSAIRDLTMKMKIYTPSTYSPDNMDEDGDEDEREPSESEIEDAADMSFDFESDSDSDADDYDDGSDCETGAIAPDEHESIMDVCTEAADASSAPSVPLSSPPPEAPPAPAAPMTIQISSTPELPRLSTFHAHGIREWIMPDLKRGTPSRVHPRHCGGLSREELRAAAQRDREAWRAMWQ